MKLILTTKGLADKMHSALLQRIHASETIAIGEIHDDAICQQIPLLLLDGGFETGYLAFFNNEDESLGIEFSDYHNHKNGRYNIYEVPNGIDYTNRAEFEKVADDLATRIIAMDKTRLSLASVRAT